jgi:zinc transporter ZupT
MDAHAHESNVSFPVAPVAPGAIESTMDLRIAAAFVVLLTSLLGAAAPLLLLRHLQDSVLARATRAFSAGIILSLSLVHIIPEATEDLEGLTDFPVACSCAAFGVLLMVLIEQVLNGFLVSEHGADDHRHHQHHHEPGHMCRAHASTASWLRSAPKSSQGSPRAQVRGGSR